MGDAEANLFSALQKFGWFSGDGVVAWASAVPAARLSPIPKIAACRFIPPPLGSTRAHH